MKNDEMIDAGIRKLDEQATKRSLDGIEAEIWAGADTRVKAHRLARVVFSAQAAVLAIALLGSLAVGTRAVVVDHSAAALDVFSTPTDLAPSSRLVGR